jgi:hypothetical protein
MILTLLQNNISKISDIIISEEPKFGAMIIAKPYLEIIII